MKIFASYIECPRFLDELTEVWAIVATWVEVGDSGFPPRSADWKSGEAQAGREARQILNNESFESLSVGCINL